MAAARQQYSMKNGGNKPAGCCDFLSFFGFGQNSFYFPL